MRSLIEFSLEDGSSVIVEGEEPPRPITRGGAQGAVVTQQASRTFEQALDNVRPVAQTLVRKLRQVPDIPSEISVEFGVQLSGEMGALIARVATDANFKLSMTWRAPA